MRLHFKIGEHSKLFNKIKRLVQCRDLFAAPVIDPVQLRRSDIQQWPAGIRASVQCRVVVNDRCSVAQQRDIEFDPPDTLTGGSSNCLQRVFRRNMACAAMRDNSAWVCNVWAVWHRWSLFGTFCHQSGGLNSEVFPTRCLAQSDASCELSAHPLDRRDAVKPVSRYLLFPIIALALGIAIWQVAERSSRAYERMLVERVKNGLEVLGYDWVEVKADGLKLELHGHAPDTFARELALESARATAPIATVTSYATATLAPPERRDPVRVELLRDKTGVTMTGQTANRQMSKRLNDALIARDAGLEIQDLTGIQAAPPPRGWGAEIDIATLAASALPNAYVVMEPGQVLIDGQAANAEERARLVGALRRAAGEAVDLSLRIRIPARVIAPFVFSAEKEPGQPIRLEMCAVRTEEEEGTVRAMLAPAGSANEILLCQVGLGGPSGDWTGAIAAGLSALDKLPAGRIEIEYRHAHLNGAPPTSPVEFEAASKTFIESLPEGFKPDTALLGDDVATRIGIERELFWMTLTRSSLGITISGQVPSEAAATAISAYAIAIFGADVVTLDLRVVDRPPPKHWQIAALAMLDQLALSSGGDVRLAGYTIAVRGELADPKLAHQIHHELTDGLPDYDVTTVFEFDLPARMAVISMPGPRCADRLSKVQRQNPIKFSTGSTRITKDSGPVLDALARVFEGCTTDPIEVGGHTDSQGAEDLNQRVSQARAESVVTALAERGVARARLIAKGYGESVPVADNQTEEGRARNRRIEFLAAPKPLDPKSDGTKDPDPEVEEETEDATGSKE